MPMKEAHLRRWQLVAAFVAITAAFVIGLWKVQHDSASIAQLQHTNCSLKQFLVTAEQTRVQLAAREHGLRKRQDERAARGYNELARRFNDGAIGRCKVPLVALPKH